MRALFFDGRRDQTVGVPKWVRPRVCSEALVSVTCERCGAETEIDTHCGSAERRHEAERALGRFCLFHERCRPRVRAPLVLGRPPLERYDPVTIITRGRR